MLKKKKTETSNRLSQVLSCLVRGFIVWRGHMCPPRSGSQVARPRAPHAGERKCVPNKVTTQPKLPGLGDQRSGKGNAKPKWLQDGGPGGRS